ncbi:amino-acid N-acetyltransferase [Jatrophihabitans sp. YIM 134969]
MSAPAALRLRHARASDVPSIKRLVDVYAGSGRRMLAKELSTLYEDVQEFTVVVREDDAAPDHRVVGCGALHVLWGDLGEVRTLAVDPDWRGRDIGAAILARLVERARDLELSRLFALTFQTNFFGRHGFVEIEGTPVDAEAFDALRRSWDPGVAEFLGLEYAKPNTLGNSRMLLEL